jgi:Right handed beta helix region
MMLLFLLVLLCPLLSQAATYYVSKSGSNGNSCATAQSAGSSAKLTINDGAACVSGGDTLIVQDGVYDEWLNDVTPSGSAGAPTTFKAQNRFGATIRPPAIAWIGGIALGTGRQWIVIDGFVIDLVNTYNTGIMAAGSHIVVQYNEVKNMVPPSDPANGGAGLNTSVTCTDVVFAHNKVHDLAMAEPVTNNTHGIYIKCNNVVVENNEFYNIASHGIQQYNQNTRPEEGSTGSSNLIVRNNYVHDVYSRGILLSSGSNNVAYNNVVYRAGLGDNRPAMHLGEFCTFNCSTPQAYNNTVVSSPGNCIRLSATQNATVKNNICWQNGVDSVVHDGDTNTTSDHNLEGVNPQFAGTTDFHLTANSVAALDTGVTIGLFNTDFEGNPRPGGSPAWDRGADERVSATAPGTYFVAKTGSDANSCTTAQSLGTPKLTIASALTCAQAGGGDNIYIRTGTYTERIDSTVQSVVGGASFAVPTLIAAYQSEVVTLAPTLTGSQAVINLQGPGYMIFDKLILDAGNVGANALTIGGASHHIRVQNAVLKNATQAIVEANGDGNEILSSTIQTNTGGWPALYQASGTGLKVESNVVTAYDGGGIQVMASAIVRANTIHDGTAGNTGAGVIVRGASVLVANNLIYGSKRCLRTAPGANNVKFYNNTCYNNTTPTYGGIYLDPSGATPSVRNNILYQSQGIVDDTGTATYGGNFCETAGTGCAAPTGNPLFTTVGGVPFHLAAGSPARDMGVSLLADVPTDKDGTARPINGVYDAGVFEELFLPPPSGETAPPMPFELRIAK